MPNVTSPEALPPTRRGLFVALEGTDGAGSTSQGDLLAERLRSIGHTVIRTAQPSPLEIGRLLRQVLRGEIAGVDAPTVALLFAADRVDHWQRLVAPALAAGQIVVCDRYVGSSLAFQVVDGAGGITPEWILAINARAHPADLTLWFDVPVDVAVARIAARGQARERFEVTETLQQVRARYTAIMADPPPQLGRCLRFDASQSLQAVAESVWQAVADLVPAPAGR